MNQSSPKKDPRQGPEVLSPIDNPVDDNPKTVYGTLKAPTHAIPPVAILHLGAAMETGENKYGLFNWRHRTVSSSVYYDALQRHVLAWWDGETVDPDSGVPHLAHVMACCAVLLDAEQNGSLHDNRSEIRGGAPTLMEYIRARRSEESPSTAPLGKIGGRY